MTNYENYPGHRFERGTCIICFEDEYSWCTLSKSQKKYLAESSYLDGAKRIDIKLYDGKVYALSVEEFKQWVSSGKAEPISSDSENDNAEIKICVKCGKPMKIRIARRGMSAGKQFWGCTGYPECKYTEQMEE